MDLVKNMKDLMSVSEIAFSLGVNSRTITRYVNKLFPNKIKNGKQTLLDEKEVTLIKLDLDKNKHLDTSVQLPKTKLEKTLLVQQAMGFLNEEIDELKRKVEDQALELKEAQPKIEFVNHIEVSKDSISVADFSRLLNKKGVKIGQNRLFKYFYDQKYLMDSDKPYQKWMDQGLFEVKKVPYLNGRREEKTAHKIMVTGKGQTRLTKIISAVFSAGQLQF